MTTITQTASAALTATRAPSTKAKPVNIAVWEDWFQFQTFQDPQLTNLLSESARFVLSVKAREEPRWLTLAGSSGAGKTYLAKRILRWVRETRQFRTKVVDGEMVFPDDFVYWPDAAVQLQKRLEPDGVYDAPKTQFLVIDEVGSSHDSSGYVTNRMAVILGQRDKKWTVITSNLTVEQIGDKIDTRIASRLIRGKNRVVDVDVMDYALRGK